MRRYSSDIKWFQLSQSWDYLKDINYVRYWVMVCHLDWAMGCPGWVLFWVHLWLYFWLRSAFQSYPSKADCPPQGERHSIQSVQLSCSVMSDSLWPHGLQHARLPCPSPTPGACWNSWTSSSWCYLTISCSLVPFSSCLQSFPTSRSFPRSQFFTSGGQRIGVSASASVLPMNTQDWSPLGWTGWISLQSKGLSRVFNTTVQKRQFFGAQLIHWRSN